MTAAFNCYLFVVIGVSVFLMNRPQTPSGLLKSPWAVKKLNKKLNNDKSEVRT